MSSNECYVYFGLSSTTLDPTSVTDRLGLRPSRSARAGDTIPRGRVRREGSWELDDRLERDARVDFEARVKDVLDQLAPCFDDAAQFARAYHGTIMLVGYFREYDPGLWLESDTVQRIAALGASFQCDFYNLLAEEPNQSLEPTATAGTPPATQEPRQP